MGAGSGKVFMGPAAAINNDGLAIVPCTNSSGHAMIKECAVPDACCRPCTD